ncbi:hypothetical protein [Streptomyces yangpuensis]|uniref:hypothetical protein n=1 Tax=Streptomyces yangpuensis TaxID=1648182 RepID=UPI00382605D9
MGEIEDTIVRGRRKEATTSTGIIVETRARSAAPPPPVTGPRGVVDRGQAPARRTG